MQDYNVYFEFIRFSIGSQSSVSDKVKGIDWHDFLDFCQRQSIAGLVFNGIERAEPKIPQEILLEWIRIAETIKAINKLVDKRCAQISKYWEKRDYQSCILKGQANAMMYPWPELRSPGDIDIWVDGDTIEIIKIAQQEAPQGHYSLHHVTMPVFSDTSVEVHYRPVFLDNWWLDKKLKLYTEKVKEKQFNNKVLLSDTRTEICSLTDDFNVVFLMLHMWHHLLSTRNSLKQLIDYYFLLKRGFSDKQKGEIARRFSEFGVLRYAGGIMWIMHVILGLDEKLLLVEPNERIGRLLINEVLHYGERVKSRDNKIKILVRRVSGNLHLLYYFPMPVLIAPLYLIWHRCWRLKMKNSVNRR